MAEPHRQLKKTFEINKGVAFTARRLYPTLLGSIALAQRVLLAMLQAGGVCVNHWWFCRRVSFVAGRKDCEHVCGRAVVGVTLEDKGQFKAKERKEKRWWQHLN